jgi:hypothetical protein
MHFVLIGEVACYGYEVRVSVIVLKITFKCIIITLHCNSITLLKENHSSQVIK